MFARHRRFVLAFVIGLALAGGALVFRLAPGEAVLVGANGFFLIYLAMMAQFIAGQSPDALRRHAALSDEGVPLIAGLALCAVALSLTAIGHALSRGQAWEAVLAIASVPLGWMTLHVLAAFHYAALWYDGEARGLDFPGADAAPEPDAWDFLYFSFTIGMTAQVSDVVITRPTLRRLVLAHGVVSFFYNTVIVALAVNAAIG
ncbi:DUF1345 domain-containing protein [Gemmobacter serpentinus]|uniref:DUF1345 domain-containing protein n=1 Tax=Gemmobacter serpentinus TaxID=2652247 RepID=UPI00124EE5C9|nr:DUF1345 domain-containing protein [Gemmobacter serpentinus]